MHHKSCQGFFFAKKQTLSLLLGVIQVGPVLPNLFRGRRAPDKKVFGKHLMPKSKILKNKTGKILTSLGSRVREQLT